MLGWGRGVLEGGGANLAAWLVREPISSSLSSWEQGLSAVGPADREDMC
jgi:hypothetical protein